LVRLSSTSIAGEIREDRRRQTLGDYPNYFNTFCARLRADSFYATLIGNRSTVFRLMGNVEEADKHQQEAEDFGPGLS
jgi:hypothetical protein